jgi:hypothetical protein
LRLWGLYNGTMEAHRCSRIPFGGGGRGLGSRGFACAPRRKRAHTGGTQLGNALRSSWERLQEHANINTTGDYEGLLVEPSVVGAVDRQLQGVLTKEVELVKHDELVAELVKLHQHDRRWGSHPQYGWRRGLHQRAG